MKMDREVAVQNLKLQLKRFRDQLEWTKFHDLKNLAEASSIEAFELLELFPGKNQASAPAFPSEQWL